MTGLSKSRFASGPPVTSLIAGSNVTLSPSDGKGAVAISASGTGGSLSGSTYMVYQKSGTTYAIDQGTGATKYSGTVASTVLNDLCLLASSTQNVTILLDSNFVCDSGTVTIKNPNVAMIALSATQSLSIAPLIPNLTVSDVSYQISGVYLYGFTTNTFTRNSGANGISVCTCAQMAFIRGATQATSCIIDNYESNGTTNGMQYWDWDVCWFRDQNPKAGTAFWQMNFGTGATVSNGHQQMSLCTAVTTTGTLTADYVFIGCTGAINSGPPIINSSQFDFVTLVSGSGFYTRFIQCTVPATGGQEASFLFDNTYFESSATAGTKNIVAFTLVSGAGGQYQGVACFNNTHVVGSAAFFVTDTGSTVPAVQSTKSAGVVFEFFSNTGTPRGAPGTYLTLAPGLVQASGATAATLTQSGVPTMGWYVRVVCLAGPFGYGVTQPTAPNAGVYWVNLMPFALEFDVTTVGSATAATIMDQYGATHSYGVPVAGRSYTVNPLEQITFATAWPTAFSVRGL